MKLILDFSLLYEKLFVRFFEDQNEINENDVDMFGNHRSEECFMP